MKYINAQKRAYCFIFIAIILSSLSFVTRNILVSKFNSLDLMLIKIDFIKNYGAAVLHIQKYQIFHK